jgi:hypothetical protein
MEKSDRTAAPAVSDQVPALVLSANGLVVRRDPGAPELQESALLAVHLAENIGTQLGLPELSGLEVRLDVRQLMLLRRSDGGLEVRQLLLPARLSERARWTGGGGSDQAALDSLRDVPGVHGSFVISDLGRLLASDFPTLLDEAGTAAVGLLVLRLTEVFPRADESLLLCTLRYGSQLLFLRAVQGGVLCVLAAATVSLPAARMAMTLVANRYNRPGGEPSGPKPAPAPLLERTAMLVHAAPVEPPEVQAVLAQAAVMRPTGILWKLGIGVAAIGIGMVAVTIALTPLKRRRQTQQETSQTIITSSPAAPAEPTLPSVAAPAEPARPPVDEPAPPAEPAPLVAVEEDEPPVPAAVRANPAAVTEADEPPRPRRTLSATTGDWPRATTRKRPARRVLPAPPVLTSPRTFTPTEPPARPRRRIDPRDPYALDTR